MAALALFPAQRARTAYLRAFREPQEYSMKYRTIKNGEWVRPVRRGYYMRCCDCGLVHRFNFKLIKWAAGKKILFQAFRLKKR